MREGCFGDGLRHRGVGMDDVGKFFCGYALLYGEGAFGNYI